MRIIDADALKEYVNGLSTHWLNEWDTAGVMAAVDKQPTIEARPVVRGGCDWCESGYERCGTCRMFFDYYGDGGSNRCSGDCDDIKCAYYEPIGFCPNCGADLRTKEGE